MPTAPAARSAMLVIKRGRRRVRRRPKRRGGAGVVALAAAGDGEAVTKFQAYRSGIGQAHRLTAKLTALLDAPGRNVNTSPAGNCSQVIAARQLFSGNCSLAIVPRQLLPGNCFRAIVSGQLNWG
jgi:hypothetical protein